MKRYVEFLVGSDADGSEVEVTCNPDELNNAFNSRPDKPSYFTPVFFERVVLDRYYARSDVYVVAEAGLGCKEEWHVRIDGSRNDFVAMMLGDLGKYLPYEDQLHWRSYNVIHQGGFSREFIDRNFRNRASYWTQPDHAFIDRLSGFKMEWNEDYGWPLFLALDHRDQHMLDALHVPLHGTQAEFDTQVLALSTVLCDSINAQALLREIGDTSDNRALGSIARLERWLEQRATEDYEPHIEFLRALQALRSAGSAHRKGSKYTRAVNRLDLEGLSLDRAFAQLLVMAVELLDFLGSLGVASDMGEDADA